MGRGASPFVFFANFSPACSSDPGQIYVPSTAAVEGKFALMEISAAGPEFAKTKVTLQIPPAGYGDCHATSNFFGSKRCLSQPWLSHDWAPFALPTPFALCPHNY